MSIHLREKKAPIVFRCDASLKIGIGHVMRCMALAMQMRKDNFNVIFVCRDHDGNLIEFIGKTFQVYTLKSDLDASQAANDNYGNWLGVSQEFDAKQTLEIIHKIAPQLIIVDHYALDEAWELYIKSHAVIEICVIDDLANRRHCSDYLIDQTLNRQPEEYASFVPNSTKLLCGINFALVRDEFAVYRQRSLVRRRDFQLKRVLISIGGTDPTNISKAIMDEILNVCRQLEIQIDLVLGHNNPWVSSFISFQRKNKDLLRIIQSTNNMAEIMTAADIAIGASGTSSWERCVLGLPTIQIIQVENQRDIALALERVGAVKLVHEIDQITPLIERAGTWMHNVSEKAKTICDGRGLQRVLQQMRFIS
jgi:UDP-2,4-diacetamido-2,4,6-trideoxy-beta-L-altropyranose hydrolase